MYEDSDIDDHFFPMQQNHVDLLWIKNHLVDLEPKTILNMLVEAEHMIIYMSSMLKKIISKQDEIEISAVLNTLLFLEKSLPIFFDIGAMDIYKNSKDVIDVIKTYRLHVDRNCYTAFLENGGDYIIKNWIESSEITRVVICAIFQFSLLSGVAPNGRGL